jgi:hypothetical protein
MNKFISLLFSLLLIMSCKDNSSQTDSKKEIVIKENFITDVTKIDHIDNQANSQSSIYLFFNTAEVKQLLQKDPSLKVQIQAKITNGNSNVTISPQNLQLKIADILNGQKPFFTINTTAKTVGNYNIIFSVSANNLQLITQTVKSNFYLSHRIIGDFKSDKPLYILNQTGTASLTVKSDYADDHFFVSLDSNSSITNATKSCEFPKDINNEVCNISFTVVAKEALITAKILDEIGVSKNLLINVCGYNENTVYIIGQNDVNEIGYNKDLTLKIGRCATADAMDQALDAQLHFYDDALKTEISVNNIMAIAGHAQDIFSIHFNANEDLIDLVLTKSANATADSFKFQLPSKIFTSATAVGYQKSTNIPITNIDSAVARVSLSSKLEVSQNSSVTVGLKRDNIAINTAINFKLVNADGITDVPATKYKITENPNAQTLSLELNANDKLDTGQYLLFAALSIDPNKKITISGDTNVTVLVPKTPQFNIMPNKKHIINSFSQEMFYLAVDNNMQALSQIQQYKILANQQLFLYAAQQNQGTGCDGIELHKIINNNPTQDTPICHLATINDFSGSDLCSCTLNNSGTLDEKCVFKVIMPNAYGNGNNKSSCQINFGAQTNLNLAIAADIMSTDGLPVIHIHMENETPSGTNPFPYSGMMNMYFDGIKQLNSHWVSIPNAANIKDGSLFQDALLFTQKQEYFSIPTYQNKDFIIKNYPGRNNTDTSKDIVLPQINFTLGVVLFANGQEYINWNNTDNCPSANNNSGFLPNLGCDRGGDNMLYPNNENWRGLASFPSNAIYVNQSGVSTASGDLVVPVGWYTNYNKPNQPKIYTRQFYKKDNNTINIKLT